MATSSAGVTYLHSPDQVLMGGFNEARLLAGGNADMLRRSALDSDVRILLHYNDTCVSIYGEGGIAGARCVPHHKEVASLYPYKIPVECVKPDGHSLPF